MILALHLFGREVMVLRVGREGAEVDEVEGEDPGDCTTYPIGFTARPEMPDEVGLPDRE